MTLNEQLVKLTAYNVGFNIYEGTVIVNVTYPSGWIVANPEDEKVKMFKEEGKYYYCLSMDDNVNEIFTMIDGTIDFNKELEEKTKLFKDKVGELQQLFVNEELDILKTLEFKLKKKRVPNQRRNVSRNKPTELNSEPLEYVMQEEIKETPTEQSTTDIQWSDAKNSVYPESVDDKIEKAIAKKNNNIKKESE